MEMINNQNDEDYDSEGDELRRGDENEDQEFEDNNEEDRNDFNNHEDEERNIYEDDDDDDESAQQTDKNILGVLKKLEEISQECGDITSYKQNTKNLFEQLIYKLEENNDQIYALHHRVKYLEQECDSKDIHIEKITIAMQEAVDDCRIEAEEMVEDMSRKVENEVTQRRDVERILCRLQLENSQLKETLRIQTLPGLEKNLDQLVEEIRIQESRSYQENIEQLREVIRTKEQDYQSLKEQRECEMLAMIAVIKSAQQKIETFQHQMKIHAQTLAVYREKEEKAKRSSLIFPHPPPPGSRELYVSESETFSNPSESPKNSVDQDSKEAYHDNGKAVVPYRKKNRGKKKGTQKGTGAAPPGGGNKGNANVNANANTNGDRDGDRDGGVAGAAPGGGGGGGGKQQSGKNSSQHNSSKSKKSSKEMKSSSINSFSSASSVNPEDSMTTPRISSDSLPSSPSTTNVTTTTSATTTASSSTTVTQSPKTQAAAEHREKTSVFWSNIRLSL